MTCPHCNLFNPPTALICDCGFDFATRQRGPSLLPEREIGLEPLLKVGCFFAGALMALILPSLIALVIVVVIAAIGAAIYRRSQPKKASQAFSFFGVGIALLFFGSIFIGLMFNALPK